MTMKVVTLGVFTKWTIKIDGLELFRFDEDGNLYRIPYTKGKRSYGFRLIIMQYPSRWRINNTWYSKSMLRNKLIKDENPIMIYSNKEVPF